MLRLSIRVFACILLPWMMLHMWALWFLHPNVKRIFSEYGAHMAVWFLLTAATATAIIYAVISKLGLRHSGAPLKHIEKQFHDNGGQL